MLQEKEFKDRKAANIRALRAMAAKPAVKAIDLLEILLEQDPGLPVVLQDGNFDLPIVSVQADAEHGIRLCL